MWRSSQSLGGRALVPSEDAFDVLEGGVFLVQLFGGNRFLSVFRIFGDRRAEDFVYPIHDGSALGREGVAVVILAKPHKVIDENVDVR